MVIDLAFLDGKMLPEVGGKASNLGELIRAGLPVPPGFCVTTRAYSEVASSARLDFDSVSGSKMREALLAAPMPGYIAQAVIDAYDRLGDNVPVAVRSSATAEDLPHASFAGQQDTYLNIVGARAVLDAVRRCWASLWTDRAVVYRTTNGIDHRSVRLAVVVQRMVQAEIAGVLFTANPVTGRRRQAVIDANPGLGEAVVSGATNPDHFVVDTDTGVIVERRLGDKRFEVRSLPDGGVQHVERTAVDQACLTDAQVRSLAALGSKVEEYFGTPQDAEWAIDASGELWLTQARPITTLFPLPPGANATDHRVYFCFSVAQGLYRPITPMGLAVFRILSAAAARIMSIPVDSSLKGAPAYREAGQRVFVDLTNILQGQAGRTLLPRVFDVMEARSAAILRRLFDDPRLPVKRRAWFSLVRRVMRIAIQYGVPLRIIKALLRPSAAHKQVEQIGADLVRRLIPRYGAGAGERLEFIQRVLDEDLAPLAPRTLPFAFAGMAMLGLAGKLLGDKAQGPDLQAVLRGAPHNITTEMDLALWALACEIREDKAAAHLLREESAAELSRRYREGRLPKKAQRGIEKFLSTYGHRAVAEIDIGMPRWSDDPAHILGVLANYLRLEEPEMAPDAVFARGAAEAEAMIETLVRRAGWRGRLVRFALNRARQLAGVREIPKYYAIVALAALRRELTKIGAELAQRGRIDTADDIFFLNFEEVRAAIQGEDSRSLVVKKRELYELELRRRHVPSVLLSDGTEPEAKLASQHSADGLAGTPASAGTVSGVARVVLDPVGAHIEPGEILVAPSTDPGWTPLFLTAGGLVMEMGGANSHGAVVAREYGIPAVVGVPGATLRITTGQRIAIDGAAGTIALLAYIS